MRRKGGFDVSVRPPTQYLLCQEAAFLHTETEDIPTFALREYLGALYDKNRRVQPTVLCKCIHLLDRDGAACTSIH